MKHPWDDHLYAGKPQPGARETCPEASGAEAPSPAPSPAPCPPQKPVLAAEGRERIFALLLLAAALLIADGTIMGGNLGFTLGFFAMAGVTVWYLASKKLRLSFYGIACLALSVLLAGSFSRTEYWGLLYPAFLSVLFAWFMGLAALTGCHGRPLGGFSSVLDVFYLGFSRSFGRLVPAFRGLFHRNTSKERKKGCGSILLGSLCALAALVVLVPLLTAADDAFSGLVSGISLNFLEHFLDGQGELVMTLFFGLPVWALAYAQAVSLRRSPEREPAAPRKGIVSVTAVNTFLAVISLTYCLYLFSQLAYLFKGFLGILPDGYSASDYAKKGFWEMAVIVSINLALLGAAMNLVRREDRAPKSTRLLCLFFCVFSLILVACSMSKMVLYMNDFGLTRKRVLTTVFMLWLGACVISIAVWLFVRKVPYMKVAVIGLLIAMNFLCWADVDCLVARYNVTAYQSGRLSEMDVDNLAQLSDSAIPWIAKLTEDNNPEVARQARRVLDEWIDDNMVRVYGHPFEEQYPDASVYRLSGGDWQCWNLAASRAADVCVAYLTAGDFPVIEKNGYLILSPEGGPWTSFYESGEMRVVHGQTTYLPYGEISEAHEGVFLGIRDNRFEERIYSCEDLSPDEWIIWDSPRQPVTLFRATDVTFFPSELRVLMSEAADS